MFTSQVRPSSSWKNDGSKPEAFRNNGSDHGPSIAGAVTTRFGVSLKAPTC
jgi:hypothetical protein